MYFIYLSSVFSFCNRLSNRYLTFKDLSIAEPIADRYLNPKYIYILLIKCTLQCISTQKKPIADH